MIRLGIDLEKVTCEGVMGSSDFESCCIGASCFGITCFTPRLIEGSASVLDSGLTPFITGVKWYESILDYCKLSGCCLELSGRYRCILDFSRVEKVSCDLKVAIYACLYT